jgi:hypothetical protein
MCGKIVRTAMGRESSRAKAIVMNEKCVHFVSFHFRSWLLCFP